MSGNTSVAVGDRGRLVLPQAIRSRLGIDSGDVLVVVEADDGIVLMPRQALLRRVRAGFGGAPLVDELLADRREASLDEDRA
jgi:AbrB family looped-hinge helix DNA binding protein